MTFKQEVNLCQSLTDARLGELYIMDRKPIYFPALSCATTTYLKHDNKTHLEMSPNVVKSLRFFNKEPEPYFHHPYSLWSAAHHYKYDDLRKEMGIDKESKIFIDSGGYQLSTGTVSEKKYNNKVALEWSDANGDIFPILDRPIGRAVGRKSGHFEECLRLTVESAKYYCDHRSNEDATILNVLSAQTEPEMEQWYEQVKDFPLDGWAHGAHFGNMKIILKGLTFLIGKGEISKDTTTWYHVFGVSSPLHMLYLARVQYHINKIDGYDIQLTYDSSSFQRMLGFGNFFTGSTVEGMKQMSLSNRFNFDDITADTKLPFGPSIAFDHMTDTRDFLDNVFPYYMLGVTHNLYEMLSRKDEADNSIYFGVDEALKSSLPSKLWQNIQVIDKVFKEGIIGTQNAMNYITHHWKGKDLDTSGTGTLDSFM